MSWEEYIMTKTGSVIMQEDPGVYHSIKKHDNHKEALNKVRKAFSTRRTRRTRRKDVK